MFIGQDPGGMEDVHGTPFYYLAPAGKEFDRLIGTIDLCRETIFVTNSVKCHTPDDRGPTPEELKACRRFLLSEISSVQPRVIVTMGGPATENLLGPCDMEAVHGIPFHVRIPELDFETIVVPAYHPAAGLRNSDYALKCLTDFAAAGAVLRNRLSPAHFRDPLAGAETYSLITRPSEIIDILHGSKLVAVDTETLNWNYDPFTVQFSTFPGTGHAILANNVRCLSVLADHLSRRDVVTLIHNALFDLFVLDRLRIYPANLRDTMVMAYLLQSEPLGLKRLAFRIWGMKMRDYPEMIAHVSSKLADEYLKKILTMEWPVPDKVEQIRPDGEIHMKQPMNIRKVVQGIYRDLDKSKISMDDLWDRWHHLDVDETGRGLVEEILGEMPEGNLSMIPLEEAVGYGARDADATVRIYPYLWSRIVDQDMEGVFNLDMSIVPMVCDMMRTGLQPDLPALARLGGVFKEKMDVLYKDILVMVGKEINLRSPVQLKELLYDKLRLDVKGKLRFKKNKQTTDDKTLARIVALHPVVPKIREWRGYNSLTTKYTNTLMNWVGADGRIHSHISITNTATGRLASSKPNIMNQPTRNEDGREIRNCFVAGEGHVFVANDLSQIEMRVLAHESGDPLLLHIFRTGQDLHAITASNIFQTPVEQLDEMKQRYPAKRVGFGTVYGITAPGLQEQLLMIGLDPKYWTEERCEQLINDWFKLYHDVELYMQDLVRFALQKGYVSDMFGRRRYLETIHSSSKYTHLEAARQAGNMPIQSGAAGIFKKGMANLIPIYKDFLARGYYIRPVIPIHDDLVFEVDEDLVDIWVPLQQDVMENSVTLKIPVKSDAKVGKVWGSMAKYKHY